MLVINTPEKKLAKRTSVHLIAVGKLFKISYFIICTYTILINSMYCPYDPTYTYNFLTNTLDMRGA